MYSTLLWFDAFGLALVTVAGTAKALDVGALAFVAIAMGAVTGSVGGIIRDTLRLVVANLPERFRNRLATDSRGSKCAYDRADSCHLQRFSSAC